MKKSGRIARRLAVAGAAAACAAALVWRFASTEPAAYPVVAEERLYDLIGAPADDEGPAPYLQWIRGEAVRSMPMAEGAASAVLATDYSAASEEATLRIRYDEAKQANVLDWNNPEGWVEWKVEAPEDGWYDIVVDYAGLPGSYSNIVRGIQIDGEYPFREARRIGFERMWRDGKFPYDRNAIDNEIRPVQTEVSKWTSKRLADHSLSPEPLRFALAEGEHTIRLVGVKEPLSIHRIALASPEPIPTYSEYAARLPKSETSSAWHSRVEAERFAYKTSTRTRPISISEPHVSPDPEGRIVYNVLGGTNWQDPGDSVAWEVDVPETGAYAIDIKSFRGYNGSASVYRTIKIDGGVPFRELLRYEFEANSAMDIAPLADEQGNPYLFYLTEGKHLLEMTVDNSTIRPVIFALNRLSGDISEIERKVRAVSGNYGYGGVVNVDPSRVWEMDKYDPEMESKLIAIRDEIALVSAYLKGLYQGETDSTTALDDAVSRLNGLLRDVDNLPNDVAAFAEIKSNLNTWTKTIENQPMHLDFIVVRAPGADPEYRLPDTWDKVRYAGVNFARSFFQPYDAGVAEEEGALTVWVQRGRDYVDLLESMIAQEFTPRTGIPVNVNLVANQNVLLMSAAAGQQPDVALGFGMEVPADFAMRGAALDLTDFENFEDVFRRFNPGVMRSYTVDGKVYALPETVTYNMLFVRTDILEELGLAPPNTWEDVLAMLPTLQENAMTFMFPKLSTLDQGAMTFMSRKPDFITPYYQHGADFYAADGLRPTLNSEEGYAAFKQWTDWFAKYDLPRDVPEFFNHFRFGSIPVGVGDISMYIQLTVAAPELAGQWKMLPIPGIESPDGTIARWTSQGLASAMILSAGERKEEAWKFLEWWTSDDVQSRYANDIESLAGVEYRWHSANLNAMRSVPWTEEELLAITEQWRWAKNMPFVPGYYMLPREMDFAWNRTLLEGDPPREALEEAQMSLMREMRRKQVEFGIEPGDGWKIETYDEPYGKE
ncbi:extracellular solute-binding protein [Paenibacillus antri]|uniref:Extracellular solute-binding protein n=1 Tax=Paenibacillus antri TaxID=2582848 RepID=A0A5R9G544_9BACL|nr:extracellular solute-binding protein [Paenibacillus antri]TLS51482.1 extracellular solute-binding protein [Paenibacillus antri]